MDKATYIKSMYSILVPLCQKYGYHNVAGGMIAQSIQEGWDSLLATKYHNYWGMKDAKDYKGETIFMNNKQKTDPATYRAYSSMLDGCEGYFNFLKYPRYKSLKQCINDIDYLDSIGPCGWNSNVGYGNRCKKHLPDVYSVLNNFISGWSIGSTYTTQVNLYIREEPNGKKKSIDSITENAKLNSYADGDGFAILKKGTRVTCKDVVINTATDQIWLLIPSGYVCAKNKDKLYII